MQFMERDEYNLIDRQSLFKYDIGDTLHFIKNDVFGCGFVCDRQSLYVVENTSMYYLIKDMYSDEKILIEEDYVYNDVILLIEINEKL